MKTISTHIQTEQRPIPVYDEQTTPAQDVAAATRYQDILYYILNSTKHVRDVPIDISTAKKEIITISTWPKFEHFIGFYKKETQDTVQILRREEDLWYVENLTSGYSFRGWLWSCRVDTRTMMDIVERFFEGDAFMDTANWVVRYVEGYDGPKELQHYRYPVKEP